MSSNPDLLLIPGMYAEVHLTMEHRDHVVTLPVTAIDVGDGGARRAFVVTAENRVEIRTIDVGIETADKVEVKSGVREGEMVVIGGRCRSCRRAGGQTETVIARGHRRSSRRTSRLNIPYTMSRLRFEIHTSSWWSA